MYLCSLFMVVLYQIGGLTQDFFCIFFSLHNADLEKVLDLLWLEFLLFN